MLVETVVEDARWEGAGLGDLAQAAAVAVLTHFNLVPDGYEISLLGCGDARIAALNSDFRQKNRPTNVLSWPSEERAVPQARPAAPPPGALGDIAIAWETCQGEAQAAGIPFSDHVTHLIVHAVLHLLGYDHEDDADAALMEAEEIAILGKLGVKDPYDMSVGKD